MIYIILNGRRRDKTKNPSDRFSTPAKHAHFINDVKLHCVLWYINKSTYLVDGIFFFEDYEEQLAFCTR